eukprot:5248391-Amphidinium_carterae.1
MGRATSQMQGVSSPSDYKVACNDLQRSAKDIFCANSARSAARKRVSSSSKCNSGETHVPSRRK